MRQASTTFALGALALGFALITAAVQSQNHARAADLALVQRRCEMIEAANAQAAAQVRAHVLGAPNVGLGARKRARAAAGERAAP